jgi:hypothetical protein
MEARKDDGGKLRFDLIPVEPLRRLAEVYTIGARKYSDRNWERGLQWGRVYSALQRHATAWWGGEQNDAVDGQHHLASVAWCALALMEYERTHPELDDRTTTHIHVVKSFPGISNAALSKPLSLTKLEEEIKRNEDFFNDGKYKQGTDPYDEERHGYPGSIRPSTGEHGGV